MPPTNSTTDEGVLLQNIIAKIPTIKDPDQLRELVALAVDMTLRRTEDHPLHDDLATRVAALFAVSKADYSVDCIELLLAAKEHRPPRQVVHAPEHREKPAASAEESRPVKGAGRYSLTLSKPVMAAAGAVLLVLALAVGFANLSLSPPEPPEPPEPAATAETGAAVPDFAQQVIAAAKGVTQPIRLAGVRLYVLRGGDGATFVRVEGVPPAICASSALVLAQQGALTVFDETPVRLSRMAIGNLCRRHRGPVTIGWKPTLQEAPPSQDMPKSE